MITGKLYKTIAIICLMALILSACQAAVETPLSSPNPSVQDLAMTAAIQTMTAMPSPTPMPTATDTPVPTPTPTATITPSPTPAAFGPSDYPLNVNPLTGLYVNDATILERRPVAIKISNFPRSGRPHAGLSAADIVFEYYIGYGTNRFLAIFYGENAPQAGPIRSGRLADAQLVPMYEGIMGYSGAYVTITQKILEALGKRAIISSPDSCPAICTDGTVTGVFANTAELSKLADKMGVSNDRQNLDGMSFDPEVPEDGKPAEQLGIQFGGPKNRGEWRYDKTSGKYLRWIEDEDADGNVVMIELIDRNNKKQLAFSNVVLVYATYIEHAPTMHDITLVGNRNGQRAVLFRDGQAFEGIWKANGKDNPMQFFDPNGEPLDFKPGNTWISIMGTLSRMQEPEPGKWETQFYLP